MPPGIKPRNNVNAFVDGSLIIVPYFKNNPIQPYDQVNRIQRPLLPLFNIYKYTFCNVGYGAITNAYPIELIYLATNIFGAHSFCIKTYHHIFYFVYHPFSLGNQSRHKAALSIPRHFNTIGTLGRFYRLAGFTITGIRSF